MFLMGRELATSLCLLTSQMAREQRARKALANTGNPGGGKQQAKEVLK